MTPAAGAGAGAGRGIVTAKDAARDLIYPYVARGDSLESLVDGQMGRCGPYRAQIGGYLCDGFDKPCRRIGARQIAAQLIGGPWEVFSLEALYSEIVRECSGEPVQAALL